MKKLLLFTLILSSLNSIAQTIPNLPTAVGKGNGGFLPIEQGGETRKITADSIAAIAIKKADSVAAVLQTAINGNTSAINTKQATLVSGTSLKSINGTSLLGSGNLVISGSGDTKALYRSLTPSGSNVTWNYDTSSTVKIITAGTLNLLIDGAVPTGSAGIIIATQSATGGDSLKYLGTTLGISKVANKVSLVGFVKSETGYIFSVDTSSLVVLAGGSGGEGGFDPDAQALFTAANTNVSYRNAVNDAIVGLKAITLTSGGTAWSKTLMVNGRAGATLAEQAVNWKTPGTYNYTYNGGIVYNANGTKFDGVDDYIDMGFNPSTAFSEPSDISIVSVVGQNPNPTTPKYIFGFTGNPGGGGNIYGLLNQAGGTAYLAALNNDGIQVSNADGLGRYINAYSSSTVVHFYKNGVQLAVETLAPNSVLGNSSLVEGAVKFGADIVGHTFARIDVTQIINSKLTPAEAAAIDAVWASYESALSR